VPINLINPFVTSQKPRYLVGWVKRDVGTIYVGFAYLNATQKFEIATKLANPTKLVADRRLNPTYDLDCGNNPIGIS
jgi:hypothetical protein